MEIEQLNQEKQRTYCKPMCSLVEITELEVLAASPDSPTTPEKPELKLPPTGENGETTDPNSAKRYPSFNAWTTWD